MTNLKVLRSFFAKATQDARLAPCHISLYLGIFQHWVAQRFQERIDLMKEDLMRISKLNGKATYYKVIRELHEFGYIEYFPANGKHEKSQVKITRLDVVKSVCLIWVKIKLAA